MKQTKLLAVFLWCFSSLLLASEINFIDVKGQGTVMVSPDFVSFTVYVEERGELVSKLHASAHSKILMIQSFLTDNDVSVQDIQAMQINLSPNVQYQGNRQVQDGFVLSQQIHIKLRQLDIYATVLDGLFRIGVNRMDSFNYALDNVDIAYATALNRALKNARSKAGSVAGAVGRQLGQVVSVQEIGGVPSLMRARGEMALMDAGNVMAGQLSVVANVQVIFHLD